MGLFATEVGGWVGGWCGWVGSVGFFARVKVGVGGENSYPALLHICVPVALQACVLCPRIVAAPKHAGID